MSWFLLGVAGFLILNGIVSILTVGKARTPLTPVQVAVVVIIDATIATGLTVAAIQVA